MTIKYKYPIYCFENIDILAPGIGDGVKQGKMNVKASVL